MIKRKALILSILSIFTVIFSSCAADTEDTSHITEKMCQITSAKYLTHVTANFPSREVKFTLDYSYTKDGDDRITVISPEDVAGIALTVSQDTSYLEFDGARLETGALNENGFSPFSAIPALVTAWTNGNFAEASGTRIYDKEAILLVSRISDGDIPIEYRTWFSKDEAIPLYAEIFSDGERIIQCEFERVEHN